MDYETYTEKEMLEFARSMCRKVWNTCLLLSAMETGRIDRSKAIREYGPGEDSLLGLLARYKQDRRQMMRDLGRRKKIPVAWPPKR